MSRATPVAPLRVSSGVVCRAAWQDLLSPGPCVWFPHSIVRKCLSCPGFHVQARLRITVISTLAATRETAVEWRNLCGETRFSAKDGTFLTAAATYCFNLKRTPEAPRGCPYRLTKIRSFSRRGFRFKRACSSSTVSGHSGQIRSFRPLPNSRTWNGDSRRTAGGQRSNAS